KEVLSPDLPAKPDYHFGRGNVSGRLGRSHFEDAAEFHCSIDEDAQPARGPVQHDPVQGLLEGGRGKPNVNGVAPATAASPFLGLAILQVLRLLGWNYLRAALVIRRETRQQECEQLVRGEILVGGIRGVGYLVLARAKQLQQVFPRKIVLGRGAR